ncbi:hypothetical protein CLAFUW4_14251 [Fulvia fulva]|uniref:Uncharacterized protein n=1 Tax=Passalora fulva TaxID=5499 RepID=A0A9Q8PM72_PASFU|nr:uncharacterized protein CLAFUR5_14084 [Fulvia fulva]KAK4609065.1 hypothetical protein CLAFUR4_14253 [Fulvia fulva]KAK4609538.1 hypothetical protein CLAFUR0_14258 [Fulvia fulva]UJO25110.1 hypothetical protein CLAFUR5_14084 [Fulvia fulva]WPV22700.1 hypothetical protein CLAFUW4_14251 [Fulvia fulva]WPV37877.1 hypothetical protein CLAFUW7_14261 [Fulvia fulva]
MGMDQLDISPEEATQIPPYTTEENDWLKQHWTDEFHFLRAYGLSIYKEEHRAEGRLMVRAFIEQDKDQE